MATTPVYPAVFDSVICYEMRPGLHTSRWVLTGLDTRPTGNTLGGWLWLSVAANGAMQLFADPQKQRRVATGQVAGEARPQRVVLTPEGAGGVGGEVWVEAFTEASDAPLLATLCVDEDLAEEWVCLDGLAGDVYSDTEGMARHCAAASRRVLLLAAQMYGEQLGSAGPREDRRLAGAARARPDYRRIAVPEQLKAAAVAWALELAMGSQHQRGCDTMYSQLRDFYAARRKDAVSRWRLTLNLTPDSDSDADAAASAGFHRVTRV